MPFSRDMPPIRILHQNSPLKFFEHIPDAAALDQLQELFTQSGGKVNRLAPSRFADIRLIDQLRQIIPVRDFSLRQTADKFIRGKNHDCIFQVIIRNSSVLELFVQPARDQGFLVMEKQDEIVRSDG